MKRAISLVLLSSFALTGCAGAKLKAQQERIEACEIAHGKTRTELAEANTQITGLAGEKTDLEGKLTESAANLKTAEARIKELMKSNKDLGSSMQSSQGELQDQVKRLVAEKDEVGRRLSDAQKDKAAVDRRYSKLYIGAEKLARELEAAKKERDELAAGAAQSNSAREAAAREKAEREAKFKEDSGTIVDAVLKEMQAGAATVVASSGDRFQLSLSDALLFTEGQAKLTQGGTALLDRIGKALKALPAYKVGVEGHTDNGPVKRELFGGFASQWDLSSARATVVARYLHEHGGLDPTRISASGYGEFQPAEPNDTPEGRKANRRVVIRLEP